MLLYLSYKDMNNQFVYNIWQLWTAKDVTGLSPILCVNDLF
jgi:hypothetical protein